MWTRKINSCDKTGLVLNSENAYSDKSQCVKKLCLISVLLAFVIGLTIGLVIPLVYIKKDLIKTKIELNDSKSEDFTTSSEDNTIRTIFLNNSYRFKNNPKNNFKSVSFLKKKQFKDEGLIQGGIFWGKKIEENLPDGYKNKNHNLWSEYIKNGAESVKMEYGCGRMQNRLITFKDGVKGCVRYRQNTDQIQGELFSFYLAQILKLPNLAPSTISIVDLKTPLWQNLRNEIASAQWNSNRPIVITQFISNLDSANIPEVFKPIDRHLNKFDVYNMTKNQILEKNDLVKNFVELAQWSDLIVFDYLTANLDRIVNNLYNFQWNVNIMDAPAHNLARKSSNGLLVFLDNESGMLHGYRLLKKYDIYHSLLLKNLCVFRKSTSDVIEELNKNKNVGELLSSIFEKQNSDVIRDILPSLPEKSVKILNERIENVYNQIQRCQSLYGNS